MTAVAVIVGGGLGAFARYWLEGRIAPRQASPFPLSTLVINVSGSTALGALVAAVARGLLPMAATYLVGTGFIGGYTTFSTFTYETLRLIEDGVWRYVVWNLALSGPLSFAGAALAFFTVKSL